MPAITSYLLFFYFYSIGKKDASEASGEPFCLLAVTVASTQLSLEVSAVHTEETAASPMTMFA